MESTLGGSHSRVRMMRIRLGLMANSQRCIERFSDGANRNRCSRRSAPRKGAFVQRCTHKDRNQSPSGVGLAVRLRTQSGLKSE